MEKVNEIVKEALAFCAAVFAAAVFGAGAVGGGSETSRLRLVSPRDNEAVSLLTQQQVQHLSLPLEQRIAGFDDEVWRAERARIGWTPNPVTFVWTGIGWEAGPAAVEIVREQDGMLVKIVDVSVRTRNAVSVANLRTGTSYRWRVKACGTISDWRRFTTMPGPRLLDVDGVPNFRDIGGMTGLGGRRVRQGVLYRSAGANRNASSEEAPGSDRITASGRRVAEEELRIKTDLDLRTDAECKGMSGSPFGSDVRWVQISSGCYQGMDQPENRRAFARCFRTICDTNSLPLVFHCIGGQDRTGTLAFMLNAMLGVGEEDLSKDWEMTAFWNPAPGWFSYRKRYGAMIAFFADKYPADSLRESVTMYAVSCGITRDEIERFREFMLEGGNGNARDKMDLD